MDDSHIGAGLLAIRNEFALVHREFGTPRAFRRSGFYARNVELFYWAQVLGTVYAPFEQARLDGIRRHVMDVLVEQAHERLRTGDSIMAPDQRESVRWTWMDYQITPEVSRDQALAGRVCDSHLVKELREALKMQLKCIKRITGI